MVSLPPGSAGPGMSQHQLSMGMAMPLGANQILVNPTTPSGFPVQTNSGTGNVLLRLSNPNQPQNTSPQNVSQQTSTQQHAK